MLFDGRAAVEAGLEPAQRAFAAATGFAPKAGHLALLPDAEEPTVVPTVDPADPTAPAGLFAVQVLCHGEVTWGLLEAVKAAGARGVVVLPVEGMLV